MTECFVTILLKIRDLINIHCPVLLSQWSPVTPTQILNESILQVVVDVAFISNFTQ